MPNDENVTNFTCMCDGKNITIDDRSLYWYLYDSSDGNNVFVVPNISERKNLCFNVLIFYHSLSISLFSDYTCVYHRKENIEVTESPIWRVYVILTEILCRIGPCIILVILNLLMIHGFRTSLQRKKKLVQKVNEEKSKKSKSKVKSKYSNKTGMKVYDYFGYIFAKGYIH